MQGRITVPKDWEKDFGAEVGVVAKVRGLSIRPEVVDMS